MEKENLKANSQEQVKANKEILEQNFALAKEFIRVTKEGKVKILVNNNMFTEQEKIAMYLIGKQYAKYAGLAESEYVSVRELSSELNIPRKAVAARAAELRNKNIIADRAEHENSGYAILPDAIGVVLTAIKAKDIVNLAKLRRDW